MKKVILVFTLILFVSSAFTQNAATLKTNIQSIENLKVQDFKDAKVKAYFSWHKNYLQRYLHAVRQNDKAAIKSVFEEGKSKINEALAVMEQAKKNESEYKKVQEYSMQIVPTMREISKAPYVQLLTKEYIKSHK